MHTFEGYVITFDDSRNFQWSDQARSDAANHDPEPVRFGVIDAPVSLNEPFHRQNVPGRRVWWTSDLPQLIQDGVVLPPRGLCVNKIVFCALLFLSGYQRIDSNKSGQLVRMRLRIQQSERGSPRVADQNDFLSVETEPQVIHKLIQVGKVLRYGKVSRIRFHIK